MCNHQQIYFMKNRKFPIPKNAFHDKNTEINVGFKLIPSVKIKLKLVNISSRTYIGINSKESGDSRPLLNNNLKHRINKICNICLLK